MRFNAGNKLSRQQTFDRSRMTLQARISAIVVSISIWLLVGSASAAGPIANVADTVGKNSMPPFRSADRDLQQTSDSLSTRFFRATLGTRQRAGNRHGFPASPPGFGGLSTAAPESLALMSNSRPHNDYQQSGAFRFEHSGGAVVREIPRGYNRMCDALSGHIWNQPDGKRLCFDVRGKPGIAIQIPIH